MKKAWTGERLETHVLGQTAVEHLHRYAWAGGLIHNKKLLDAACGEGYGSALLSLKASSVTGLDIDPKTIELAKKKYRSPQLQFVCGSIESLPFPDSSFEAVTSFETLEHTDDPAKALSEIKRVLQVGGLLLISTPDKRWYSDVPGYQNPFHKKEFYKEEFRELLQSQFRNVELMEQTFFLGSLALSDKPEAMPQIYTGSFDRLDVRESLQAPYLLAMASDGELPVSCPSLFDGSQVLASALEQQEKDLKQTVTYRTGALILAPFKWMRNKWIKR